jgi:DNA polymerase III subunit gamma/tau
VLKEEAVASEPAALKLLARAARGSMRDALSLTDQAIAYGGGSVQVEAVRAMLGSVDRSHAENFVRALAVRDGRAVLSGVDALRTHGLSAAGTLEELAMLLQHMAIEQAVPGALPDTDPDAPTVRELAALMPADETQLLYSFVLQGRQELTLAPDAYAGLAMVLLRLLAFAPNAASSSPGSSGAGGGGGSGKSRPTPIAASQPMPARQAAAPPVVRAAAASGVARPTDPEIPPWALDDDEVSSGAAPAMPSPAPTTASPQLVATALGDRWLALVSSLQERQLIAALVRELAMQSQLVEQGEGATPRWRLRVDRESLRAAPLAEKLRAALVTVLDMPTLQLDVEAGEVQDSPAKRAAAERERRQRDAEQLIRNDPMVQELLAQFPTARIVPGSIKPH